MNIRFFRSTMALVVFMMSASFAQASTCPILFIRRMVNTDCNTVCNADEEQRYESLELIDLFKQEELVRKAFNEEMAPYGQKRTNLCHENNPINFQERLNKLDQKIQELTDNINAMGGVTYREMMLVYKKMRIIIEEIVKAKGAYACVEYQCNPYFLNYVDPSSDITDEVYDRLNKEYLKTKNR